MFNSTISKIAFRNIFRQKRRSLFTALTMIGGFVLLSLSISLSEGTYGNSIDIFTRSHTGHIQIHKKGYIDKPSIYKTFDHLDELGKKLKGIPSVSSWTPRILSTALAFKGKKTTVARIIGIDPVKEPRTTTIKKKIREGAFISNKPKNEVMLAGGLADVLKSKVGDEIVLISQGADGSIANDLFKVKSIMKGTTSSFDRANCYMNIKTAQGYLALYGKYHEISIVVDDYRKARRKAAEIRKVMADEELSIEPWQVIQKEFYDAMMADKQGMWYSLIIIVVIVGIGVLNTVLMAVLERTREFGVLKALGTRPKSIFAVIVLETLYLSFISVIFGFIISFVVNYIFSKTGIPYPAPIHVGGFELERMLGCLYPITFICPALVTFLTAILVSVFPALRAMRIIPMDAMRMH